MTITTKTFSNLELSGIYSETKLDIYKKTSNRLTSICGKYYTVRTRTNEKLEFVGKRSFDKWAKNNDYIADF
jgi:hypothetical protein